MRAAKARSAERGESLKTLLTRAVTAELGNHNHSGPVRKRVEFPMIRSTGPKVNITNADVHRLIDEEDLYRFTASGGVLPTKAVRGRRK